MSKTWATARARSNGMIWVGPYYRIRDGVLQHVRGHWRPLPFKKLPHVRGLPLPS
jgi:hypothetical protein